MSRQTKLWLITATSLVLVGCLIFVGVMTVLKWDFSKLSTVGYETSDYEIGENYQNISIITNTAHIALVPSENGKSHVVCHQEKKVKHSVTVKDDTLVIQVADTRKWYEHIGINFGKPKITVHIPQGEYGALSIKSSTGDVEVPKEFSFESIDISTNTGDIKSFASAEGETKIKTDTGNICVEKVYANMLDLSVSTGKVTVSGATCRGDIKINVSTGKTNITDSKCKNLISHGNTGDISLKNVLADEKFYIERSTGDVRVENSDATQISVKTSTGDVTGTLLTEKVFITQTDTGDVDVPKTVSGGICEITTDTGDINMRIG